MYLFFFFLLKISTKFKHVILTNNSSLPERRGEGERNFRDFIFYLLFDVKLIADERREEKKEEGALIQKVSK